MAFYQLAGSMKPWSIGKMNTALSGTSVPWSVPGISIAPNLKISLVKTLNSSPNVSTRSSHQTSLSLVSKRSYHSPTRSLPLVSSSETAHTQVLTSETLLFGGKNRDAGSGDKVTMAYRHWIDKLTRALTTAVPGESYIKVHSDNLVGLMTCIFVKSTEKPHLRGLDITSVKR